MDGINERMRLFLSKVVQRENPWTHDECARSYTMHRLLPGHKFSNFPSHFSTTERSARERGPHGVPSTEIYDGAFAFPAVRESRVRRALSRSKWSENSLDDRSLSPVAELWNHRYNKYSRISSTYVVWEMRFPFFLVFACTCTLLISIKL